MENIRKAQEQWYMLNNATYRAGCISGSQWTDSNGVVVFVYPTDPKNTAPNVYSASTCGGATYCVCATLENAVGNSGNATCSNWVNGTGAYYCVSNQQ